MPLWLFLIAAALLAFALGAGYRLLSLRSQLLEGWRQLEFHLTRRHDLVPDVVNAVRSIDGAGEARAAVMEARAKALTAAGPVDAARTEAQLTESLERLLAAVEQDPSLTADAGFQRLCVELSAMENRIVAARQIYNDAAARFNTAQHAFPPPFLRALGIGIVARCEVTGFRADAK